MFEKLNKDFKGIVQDDGKPLSDFSQILDSKLKQPNRSSKSQNEAFANKLLESKMTYAQRRKKLL